MSAGNESLYLIDAHSLIFQVFHAIPEMTSPSGLPTNAVFGFTKDLLYLRDEKKPTYLLAAFDVPAPTFREKIDPQYKANRTPMPDDLQLQIPLIRQVLDAMRIPVLGVPGFEADDVIATLAKRGAERGMDVVICSSDKDLRQLLSDRIKLFNLRKLQVFDRVALQQNWGITPEQVIDFQTLVGDSVDNVKGVPGIGPKTASKLLQDYGTLDNLLAHLDEIPGKKQEALRDSADIIQCSRQLVTLDTRVPVPDDWDQWRQREWDAPKLVELFRSLGFQRFASSIKKSRQTSEVLPTSEVAECDSLFSTLAPSGIEDRDEVSPPIAAANSSNGELTALTTSPRRLMQGSLFGEEEEAGFEALPVLPRRKWEADYHLVNSAEKFGHFLKELHRQERIALDVETTSLEPRKAQLVGLAFCWKQGEAWYLPLRGPKSDPVLEETATLAALKPILECARPAKVNQNIKYDLQVLKAHGIELGGLAGDSMVADYLLHAGERAHGLDILAEKHLGHRMIPIDELIGARGQRRLDQVPCAEVAQYAGEDADAAWRLCAKLEPELEKLGFKKPSAVGRLSRAVPDGPGDPSYETARMHLYEDLEIPLIQVLADMEYTGVRLDVSLLKRIGADMDVQLQSLEKAIYELAGREFNIASVKQLREVLYGEMGFKSAKKTAIMRESSTDQETLEKLARAGHPLPQKLIEQRKIAKLKGTYVDALPALVNEATGRVHASFNQTVAATGRLSSSDPNLQNIPIRSEQGGQIRQAFVPEPGWLLLAADYSQIELRLLAHFCGDETLQQAFADDRDIHAEVAAKVFTVDEEHVTAAMRRAAKTINFGVIYGISAFGLAQRLEIDKDKAAKFIDAYFEKYPRVLAYQDALLESCRKQGFVSTILGRRRTIAGIRPRSSYKGRNQPEREAINMQIQGSAADLIKVAMVKIHCRLQEEKRRARLLLQIHDELVFELPPEEKDAIVKLVEEEMTRALADEVKVPLKVDVGLGPNWLEVKS
ncbi:MAG: DNA polymerase I [Gemmataceae bacterium]|nr:DNA polymerase I [Gemmataceae bacterium]MCI0742327.1 DNA polymerase I [Gemmataceae bacterium]